MRKRLALLLVVLLIMTSMVGCSTPQQEAQTAATNKAANNTVYVQKNQIELDNYNMRQKLADDPSTILWVTCMFPSPSSPMITVPIIGKLTSSNKKPFYTADNNPGPDGMYGSSSEYRYGFGPGGLSEYYEFFNISTFATTVPSVWQREKTTLVMEGDPTLTTASKAAKDMLDSKDPDKAEKAKKILLDGIKSVQKEAQGGR